jgi:hypothetical protein
MNRRFVFKVYSTVEDYYGDCEFAVVEFTPELAQSILKRAKAVRTLREADTDCASVAFWDCSADFYSREDFEAMAGEERLTEIEGIVDDQGYMELPEDYVKLDEGKRQRTECDKLYLFGFEGSHPEIEWKVMPKHAEMYVYTAGFPLSEVEKFV